MHVRHPRSRWYRMTTRNVATPCFAVVLLLAPPLPVLGAEAGATVPKPDFEALVGEVTDQTLEDRRWLHQHPELSLREHRTQAWLRERLEEIPGVTLVDGAWGTGLVALLGSGRPGPLVAYRADIDALPIREETGLPYASTATDTMGGQTVGVMHACGHDIHTSVLLGTARVLSRVRETMPGSVLLILEPAEEIGAGALPLIEAGLFEVAGKPEAIYAIHDHPTVEYGKIGYCPGHSAANVDVFRITVKGEGSHGAYPHQGIDPVVIAARMVLAFQLIVSREIDAARQAVISVGSIQGGNASNVIPAEVEISGTVRSLEPEVRQQLADAVERTAKGIAASAGAPEPEVLYSFGTPSVYNDPRLTEETVGVVARVIGEENVIEYKPGMGGEDFSEYQKRIPGFMFRLGVGRPDRPMRIHSATFDPDERAVPLGVRLMSEILWDRLHRAP